MVTAPHVSALDRKLLRDLWRMRGQVFAVAMVALCGVATFVTMRGSYEALLGAQQAYYERYRFADVFATVRRAPLAVLAQVRAISGVNAATGRVVFDASLDVPRLDEPASGRLVSLAPPDEDGLNRVFLRSGRMPGSQERNAVLASVAFSEANHLQPGDTLGAVINGRMERLRIVGIAMSPEYVNEIKGDSFPDNRRFGVLWMDRDALAGALSMRDGINDIAVTLAPHASEKQVILQLDRLLAPYGAVGAYGRDEQLSHNFLQNELAQSRVSATVLPAIFLAVAAFLVHNVLLRLTALQRPQIGLLKSLGYGRLAVSMHYLKFALGTVMAGAAGGIALGAWLGSGLAQLYGRVYHFPRLAYSLSGFTVTAALAIAALSAIAGALAATRRVVSLSPAESMRPEAPAHFQPGPLERLGLQRWMPLPVRMVLRNLERKPVKSLLSVLGLAAALALVITGQYTFDALNEIIRVQFRVAQRDDVALAFNEPRDWAVSYELAALPGVLRVEPFRMMAATMRYRHHTKKTAIVALAPRAELRRVLDETERALVLPPQGIVLTRALAATLDIGAGALLEVTFMEGERHTARVPVVQVVDESIGMFSYMDARALAALAGEPVQASGAYLTVDPARQAALYRMLKSVPAVRSVSLREATLESFLSTVAQNMRMNTVVLVSFACIIALGVVYNAVRIALSEQAIELASLRILGFTNGEVAAMLLGQQAALTLAALPLGCLLGYGLAALLSMLLSQDLFRIPLIVSGRTYLLSIGIVLVSAIAAGCLVWRKLRRMDLIEVLKTRE